jgi:hypothetical protein
MVVRDITNGKKVKQGREHMDTPYACYRIFILVQLSTISVRDNKRYGSLEKINIAFLFLPFPVSLSFKSLVA